MRPDPPPPELLALAERALGASVEHSEAMAGGGSQRSFYRLHAGGVSAVAVEGRDRAEVERFLTFTQVLDAERIPVPRLLAAEPEQGRYVMEDLGPRTLAEQLASWRAGPAGWSLALNALHDVVLWLPTIQVRVGRALHEGRLPGGAAELDGGVFRRDIEAFLHHYLPRFVLTPEAPDAAVRADLERLVARLDALPRQHFSYRDFQARNIVWVERADYTGPVFLDYQDGMPGPLAYDLAALLFSPDTGVDEQERELLVDAYLGALERQDVAVPRGAFLESFHAIVLVRRMQALGAYARLSTVDHKPQYLAKIPPALETLRGLWRDGHFDLGLPALHEWLGRILAPDNAPRIDA